MMMTKASVAASRKGSSARHVGQLLFSDDLCAIKHIDLELAVNFSKSVISGLAHLKVQKKQDDVDTLVLDSNDLKIKQVTDQATGQELVFKQGERVKPFGSKLEVVLPSSSGLTVSISYETSPSCSALQWLRPEQTAGKRQPYLFSQCQTEQMLQTAEELLGKYEWGQYDLLVLPPSFPFGGMENPCLTFVTPTLLINTLNKSGEAAYTKLIPDLRGVDPDDAFSPVPYEKGFALLFYLETLLGGPAIFEAFLKAYIAHFKFQSISAQQWKDFLFSYFSSQADQSKLQAVDWETWFYAEGMPPFSPRDLKDFSSLQIREFLALMLQAEVINQQDKWLRLCLKGQWQAAVPRALEFVTEQGRMKFVRPIYRDLYQWEEARQAAIDNFLTHRAEMHNTTAKEVAKDLHLSH
nr:hypothetical protein BaRGS_017290 [Batillaria attramentaria]